MEDTGTLQRVCCRREEAFEWKIRRFSEIPGVVDYSCFSPFFEFCGSTCYMQLFPNGEKEERSEGYVGLYLWSDGRRDALHVQFSLGLGVTRRADTFDERSIRFCGVVKMIQRSTLLRLRRTLLSGDVLTVTATLKADLRVEVPDMRDASIQTEAESIAAEEVKDEQGGGTGTRNESIKTTVKGFTEEDEKGEQGAKTGTQRVLQDIGKMWPSDDYCDVVFEVGDVKFEAHKAILAARTPVLAAMFRHDTVEKSSGVVTIEDCEPAVFEELLHYVYRGALHKLTAENACPLYVVADKYLVSEVKELCLRCMQDTLCVETFCDTVALSLVHKEDELLETAVKFFSRNMIRVVETVQWQTFIRDHSTWANEILLLSLKIATKKDEERRADADSSRA